MQENLQAEDNKIQLLHARLTDTEKGHLYNFCKNEAMIKAVEKALLYAMYQMGTVQKDDQELMTVNWAFIPHNANTTDEDLGRALRAKIEGLSMMYDAFKQIKKFGVDTVTPTVESNPAL